MEVECFQDPFPSHRYLTNCCKKPWGEIWYEQNKGEKLTTADYYFRWEEGHCCFRYEGEVKARKEGYCYSRGAGMKAEKGVRPKKEQGSKQESLKEGLKRGEDSKGFRLRCLGMGCCSQAGCWFEVDCCHSGGYQASRKAQEWTMADC